MKRSGATADVAPGNDPTDWLAGWHPNLGDLITVHRIANASHALVPEQPAAIAQAIVAWAAQRFSAP